MVGSGFVCARELPMLILSLGQIYIVFNSGAGGDQLLKSILLKGIVRFSCLSIMWLGQGVASQ